MLTDKEHLYWLSKTTWSFAEWTEREFNHVRYGLFPRKNHRQELSLYLWLIKEWNQADPSVNYITEEDIWNVFARVQEVGSEPPFLLGAAPIEEAPEEPQATTPAAPTNGIVDDEANTFTFTPNPLYNITEHEWRMSVDNGTTWTAWGQCESNILAIGNINLPSGMLQVRVKAGTNRNASATLANASAFTLALPPNQSPTITLSADSSTVPEGTQIVLTATPLDSDGTIVRVDFYEGTTLLDSAETGPWTYSIGSASAGVHYYHAVAVDDRGAQTTSATVTVTVVVPGNEVPTISLASDDTNVLTGDPVLLTATVADSDGTIAKVEFFDGATKLGERTTTPWTYVVSSVSLGTHNYTAKATDDDGGTATSNIVTVFAASPSNTPPTIGLSSNGVNVFEGTNVVLTATPADANGSIAQVRFYEGAALLGIVSSAPWTHTIVAISQGMHTYHAIAIDNEGAQTVSPEVVVSATVETGPNIPTAFSSDLIQLSEGTHKRLDAITGIHLANDEILIGYNYFGVDFADSSPSTLAFRRSTDNGDTWTPIEPLALKGGLSNMIPSFYQRSNGTLVCLFLIKTVFGSPSKSYIAHMESTDNGLTWSAATALTPSDDTLYVVNSPGRIFKMPNGDLLYPYSQLIAGNGASTVSTYYGKMLRSTDDGATWASYGADVINGSGGNLVVEGGLYIDSTNALVYYFRTGEGVVKARKSTDSGLTWGSLYTLFAAPNSASVITKVSTGKWLAIHNDIIDGIDGGTARKNMRYSVSNDGINFYLQNQKVYTFNNSDFCFEPDVVDLPAINGVLALYSLTNSASYSHIYKTFIPYTSVVVANKPPKVVAAADQVIQAPASTHVLNGTASEDAGVIIGYQWTQISGPSIAVIDSPNSLSTAISGLIVGDYVFRLSAFDDDGETGTDDMTVTVLSDAVAEPLVGITGDILSAGMRRMRPEYSGPWAKIRRASDNTEQDINFLSNGDPDIAALNTFVGGGSWYFSILYDNSGNGMNLVQTTLANQPVGSLVGGKPVMDFTGTQWMTVPTSQTYFKGLHNGQATVIALAKAGNTADMNALAVLMANNGLTGANIGYAIAFDDRASQSRNNAALTLVTTGAGVSMAVNDVRNNAWPINQYVILNQVTKTAEVGAQRSMLTVNGVTVTTANIGSSTASTANATYSLQLGANGNGANGFIGQMKTIAIFSRALSDSERSVINNNENSYHSVYTT